MLHLFYNNSYFDFVFFLEAPLSVVHWCWSGGSDSRRHSHSHTVRHLDIEKVTINLNPKNIFTKVVFGTSYTFIFKKLSF